MTLSDKLKEIRDILSGLSIPVYHYYHPPKVAPPFIQWAEDGEEDSFYADNRTEGQQIHGTIDYYTLTEYDAAIDAIQAALDGAPAVGWRLSSVQYEDETNLVHYEWEFWHG